MSLFPPAAQLVFTASGRGPVGRLLFGTPSPPAQCSAAEITRQIAGFTRANVRLR
jgi:hypothetical protein